MNLTIEDAYYMGFAEALLYAQAHNDVEGGSQTMTTHLPEPTYIDDRLGFLFDKDKLVAAIRELDDEGGVIAFRFDKDKYGSDTIEIASSEGHHGMPDWV